MTIIWYSLKLVNKGSKFYSEIYHSYSNSDSSMDFGIEPYDFCVDKLSFVSSNPEVVTVLDKVKMEDNKYKLNVKTISKGEVTINVYGKAKK